MMVPSKIDDPTIEDDTDRSSDEDFNPEGQPNQYDEAYISSSSDNEDDAPTSIIKKPGKKIKGRKTTKRTRDNVNNDVMDLDSGDEATIQERKKRRKKDEDGHLSHEDDDNEILIKTRAQRATEKQLYHTRPLASTTSATIDVDAAWSRLSSLGVSRPIPSSVSDPSSDAALQHASQPYSETSTGALDPYITIHRTTRFAGHLTTESRRVLRDSAEARIYLAEQKQAKRQSATATGSENALPPTENDKENEHSNDNDNNDNEKSADTNPNTATQQKPIRRPLKRPSRFEPNPLGEVKALPAHLQVRWPRRSGTETTTTRGALAASSASGPGHQPLPPGAAGATKLNTVEKSRHDWAGFVDRAGLADELDEYGKSKQNYLGRKEFLERVEGRQEGERREVRIGAAQGSK